MSDVRGVMLDIVGDDIEEIAKSLATVIGWGNGAVFDDEHRCGCMACEQERDDVRAALLTGIAQIIVRRETRLQP